MMTACSPGMILNNRRFSEMSRILTFISNSARQTEDFGNRLGEFLRTGDVVVLTGELGAGKTTLVRGVVRRLHGVSPVKSPSFIIVNEYPGSPAVFHIDMYRVDSVSVLDDICFDDLINEGIVLIEWGEKIEGHLPDGYLKIELKHLSETAREISIYGGAVWQERLNPLRSQME